MTDELKPCPNPWCKSNYPIGVRTNPPLSYREGWCRLHCANCGLLGPEAKTAEEAHELWQTRPEEDLLRARIAELENRLFQHGAMDKAPCFVCGYRGPNYYQPETHPCAERHHRLKE